MIMRPWFLVVWVSSIVDTVVTFEVNVIFRGLLTGELVVLTVVTVCLN